MKLITNSKSLTKEFKRLIIQYNNFYWASAWASSKSEIFELLRNHRSKIKKLVVGIHFYQTDPNFINEFLNEDTVHFIEQPDGTFHPKIYLFINDELDWELIVGSANFTHSAFTKNTEASILLNHESNKADMVLSDSLKLIEKAFNDGKVFNEIDLENYKIA